MEDVDSIIARVASTVGCSLARPTGYPVLASDLEMPPDLKRFYEVAGGAIIYSERVRPGPVRVLQPRDFRRIDETVSGQSFAGGPFQFWYAIADVSDGNYIAIDLNPKHFGKCYDCFHETFASPGCVNIIAISFTDLLNRLLSHTEDSSYWLEPEFEPFGEAFELYGYRTSD